MASRLRLIILGAPGSGKGTISSRIVRDFKLKHVSSGDILRANVDKGTPTGFQVKSLIASGQYVPDELMTRIVLPEVAGSSGWLLDGYPRTLQQCKAMEERNINLDKVINLNVPFSVIINRLKYRWIHPGSGRVYNLEFNPPKKLYVDDLTGENLIQRPDDREEVVLKRLKEYEKQTKPIIDYFASKSLLATYTGETSDYLWPLIRDDLEVDVKKQAALAPAHLQEVNTEPVTHTGQQFAVDDSRRVRFVGMSKLVNKNIAMKLVHEDPIVVAEQRVVCSSSAGPLGHPKIYINIDSNEVHTCGYSGRRFIRKKFYDEAKHGKSITYNQYLDELRKQEQKFITSKVNN